MGVNPSQKYLSKIGELAYLVSKIEWRIIDDIRLASTSIDAMHLHGLPTGAIGRALEEVVSELSNRPNVQHFVATSAKALINVAGRRNTVLHARPGATRTGDFMLVKLRVEKSGDVDSVWVSDAFLDQQLPRFDTGSVEWSERASFPWTSSCSGASFPRDCVMSRQAAPLIGVC